MLSSRIGAATPYRAIWMRRVRPNSTERFHMRLATGLIGWSEPSVRQTGEKQIMATLLIATGLGRAWTVRHPHTITLMR
jgi:hypothetical protein